jgi:hypothetical protein
VDRAGPCKEECNLGALINFVRPSRSDRLKVPEFAEGRPIHLRLCTNDRSAGKMPTGPTASPQRVRPVADKMAVLHAESFAEIELTADRVVDEEILGAFAFDPAFIDQVGAIDDR